MHVQNSKTLKLIEDQKNPLINEFMPITDDFLNTLEFSDIYNNYNINLSIDSIHIVTTLSPYDIDKKIYKDIKVYGIVKKKEIYFSIEEVDNSSYSKEYEIHISKNNAIKVRYSKCHNTFTYEFGGLSQYNSINETKIHILREVYKNIISISRIDLAFDLFANYKSFKIPKSNKTNVFKYDEGTYYNSFYHRNNGAPKQKFTLYAYDKNHHLLKKQNRVISYNNITRLELRLYNQFLTNKKLKHLFDTPDSINKLEHNVIDILNNFNILYDNKRIKVDGLKVKDTIFDFIKFLEFDTSSVPYKNYSKFTNEIKKQSNIISTIQSYYKLDNIQDILTLIENKTLNKLKISQDTGVHRNTISKLVTFLKEYS